MGFDQYHEPPDELPAQTRTFARMCANLTEEAEIVGIAEASAHTAIPRGGDATLGELFD